MAIPRFIQMGGPSPPLKPMDQSRHGVIQSMEAQESESPHAVIDPSVLRAAKAYAVE
jgi:hypothetical protein